MRSADPLLITGGLLVLMASVLNLVVLSDRPDAGGPLSWWGKVRADTRRHPRVRVIQLGCLAAGLALEFVYLTA